MGDVRPPLLWDEKHIGRLWIVPALNHPGWNYVHGVLEKDGGVSSDLIFWFNDRGRALLTTSMIIYNEQFVYACLDHPCNDDAAVEIRMRWGFGTMVKEGRHPPFDGYYLA